MNPDSGNDLEIHRESGGIGVQGGKLKNSSIRPDNQGRGEPSLAGDLPRPSLHYHLGGISCPDIPSYLPTCPNHTPFPFFNCLATLALSRERELQVMQNSSEVITGIRNVPYNPDLRSPRPANKHGLIPFLRKRYFPCHFQQTE